MKLAKREKYMVSFAVFAVAVFCLLQFMVFPFFEKRDNLRRGVKGKEQDLQEILALSVEYQTYKKGSQGVKKVLANRKKGFTLFSFLEKAAGAAEVKQHIKYMKPSKSQGSGPYKESLVELKLESITLKQLVNYLYRVESPENVVRLKRVSIKENKKEEGYMDAILQVLTFE